MKPWKALLQTTSRLCLKRMSCGTEKALQTDGDSREDDARLPNVAENVQITSL
jgi:hypothetical protein